MNNTEVPHLNPDESFADKINSQLITALNWVFAASRDVPGFVWAGIGIAICVIGYLVGFSAMVTAAVWILIAAFTLLSIAYGVGVVSDAKSRGLMGASGKLSCLCCALVAALLFMLLPANQATIAGRTPTRDATLAYWNSLKSISNRCEMASQKLEAMLSGESEAAVEENPFDSFRSEVLQASKEINQLSLANVDSDAIELGIELDAILLESLGAFDDIMDFMKSQWTVGGFMKALLVGTKEEEARMSAAQKRLQDRAIRWSDQQTKVRINLSKRFGQTFPRIDPL